MRHAPRRIICWGTRVILQHVDARSAAGRHPELPPSRCRVQVMMQELRREVAILQRVSADANVVQFYGAVLPDGRAPSATALPAMLVMEYLAVSGAGFSRQPWCPPPFVQRTWVHAGTVVGAVSTALAAMTIRAACSDAVYLGMGLQCQHRAFSYSGAFALHIMTCDPRGHYLHIASLCHRAYCLAPAGRRPEACPGSGRR